MILITGATGQLGKAVVDALLTKIPASEIAVLVRDEAKAAGLKEKGVELRKGDYDDYSALVKAFTGIDKLYFVSGSDVVNRSRQHQNVTNAAKEAGVKHVLYTSFQRNNETESSPIALVAKSHIATENALKESGLAYTILKHNIYTDMLPIFMGEKVIETGTIFLPAGDGKCAYATRNDMAEAAANILTSPGHENKVYDITNTEAYSYNDVAATLSAITGKKISYVSPSREEYEAALTKAGVPAGYIGLFAGFSEAKKEGEFSLTDDTLAKLLGRKPATLKQYLESVYAS